MAKTCIVTYGAGAWYPQGVKRLSDSLDSVGYDGDRRFYVDALPPGCPTHQEMPYAFKPYALEEAVRRGSEIIVWCDAAVWFVQNPRPFFSEVERKGYWGPLNGWNCGQWCTDEALPLLGVTRDEAWKIPQIMACFFALDMRTDIGKQVMEFYSARARDGSFKGPWSYSPEAAPAPGVLGHRHDQTALSIIWNRLGLELTAPPCLFEYYYGGDYKPHVIAYSAGM